ncbi:MAG: hydrolase [Pyrinomonadaceae bacterium]
MSHSKILDRNKTALVVVDIQEAFRSVISEFPIIASQASKIVSGFQILDLPIFVTEQYPKGLGRTAEEILMNLPADFEIFEKTTFSSCGSNEFNDKIKERNISQVLLCGLETHICVNQTAHSLLNRGIEVHLLTDVVGSRYTSDKETALQKMKLNGVMPSSIEMALFELLRDAKHEQFKEIQNLIK